MTTVNTRNAIILDQEDNVATMLQDVAAGESVFMGIGDKIETMTANSDIPYGHKIARCLVPEKAKIKKYGTIIGEATIEIQPGDYVHTQNVISLRGRGDLPA